MLRASCAHPPCSQLAMSEPPGTGANSYLSIPTHIQRRNRFRARFRDAAFYYGHIEEGAWKHCCRVWGPWVEFAWVVSCVFPTDYDVDNPAIPAHPLGSRRRSCPDQIGQPDNLHSDGGVDAMRQTHHYA